MATLGSLPPELVFAVVEQCAETLDVGRITNPAELRSLGTLSPAFDFAASTILHRHVALESADQARSWLAMRDPVIKVRSLEILDLERDMSTELATEVVRACSKGLASLSIRMRDTTSVLSEENLRKLKRLYVDEEAYYELDPPAALSFLSLTHLSLRNDYSSCAILLAASTNLTHLVTSPPDPELVADDYEYLDAFQRVAGNLLNLTLQFHDQTDSSSVLIDMLKFCSRLEILCIDHPRLSFLRELLSHLPHRTLHTLTHYSRTFDFLPSEPNTLAELKAILELEKLGGMTKLYLDWDFEDVGGAVDARGMPVDDEDGQIGAFIYEERDGLVIEDVMGLWKDARFPSAQESDAEERQSSSDQAGSMDSSDGNAPEELESNGSASEGDSEEDDSNGTEPVRPLQLDGNGRRGTERLGVNHKVKEGAFDAREGDCDQREFSGYAHDGMEPLGSDCDSIESEESDSDGTILAGDDSDGFEDITDFLGGCGMFYGFVDEDELEEGDFTL